METEENDDDNGDEDMDNDDTEQRKRGRPKKPWNESSKDSKNRKTDEIMDDIRQNATELGISVTALLLFLGKRDADINGDTQLSKLFEQLNRSKENGEPKISPQKAVALKKFLSVWPFFGMMMVL